MDKVLPLKIQLTVTIKETADANERDTNGTANSISLKVIASEARTLLGRVCSSLEAINSGSGPLPAEASGHPYLRFPHFIRGALFSFVRVLSFLCFSFWEDFRHLPASSASALSSFVNLRTEREKLGDTLKFKRG